MKSRRATPAKRPAREIETKLYRAQKRQQRELQERFERRSVFPEPEQERYKP